MARARTTKIKRKPARKKQAGRRFQIPVKGILYTFLLLSFLLFSVGMLTYVVFFRIVVAAELEPTDSHTLLFEEPVLPAVVPYVNGMSLGKAAPRCAIIVDDMGYHRQIGKDLIDLPFDLTFSFLPHAPHTAELENLAYLRGRTVMLHLPLQPKDQVWDPGPGAMYVDEGARQRELFFENLDLVPHATGVNNHMGSLYTEKREVMESLLELIDNKQLFFVDSFTSADSLAFSLARERGMRTAKRQIFLDNVEEVAAICDRLDELVASAVQQGQAIGIAHPHRATLQALQKCLESMQTPVQFVGVDQLVH